MRTGHSCLVVAAYALFVPLFAIFVAQIFLNHQAEAKAWSQLTDHYRTENITTNERTYFGAPTYYYAYAQICYDISVHSPSGSIARKVAMVSGDDDGGTFRFSGEFPSMTACKAKFNRG